MSLHQHSGELSGHVITIETMHGNGRTLPNAIRLCGMNVTSNVALDMTGSLHQIILYLLKSEQGGFGI